MNHALITINQADSVQLIQSIMVINKPSTSCNVTLSAHKDPALQYADIFFSNYQVFFDLAKTFGIILQKVNPQPL